MPQALNIFLIPFYHYFHFELSVGCFGAPRNSERSKWGHNAAPMGIQVGLPRWKERKAESREVRLSIHGDSPPGERLRRTLNGPRNAVLFVWKVAWNSYQMQWECPRIILVHMVGRMLQQEKNFTKPRTRIIFGPSWPVTVVFTQPINEQSFHGTFLYY